MTDEYEHLRESADSDTPRDPLAAQLDDALIGMVRTSYPMPRNAEEKGWSEAIHAARKAVRNVIDKPMPRHIREALDATRPNGSSRTADLATRPSRDEALRVALETLDTFTYQQGYAPTKAESDAQAALATIRATLATPSSAPDVEGLRHALELIRDTTLDQPAAVNVPVSDWNYRMLTRAMGLAATALRDSRS